ncbi:MAG: hypothetical protein MJ098_01690 [Saccharofermentans sp.]|nr:hypothetical protein [Saccharofermentans sp.]
MENRVASNIKVDCIYHPNSCYIQNCKDLISSFDLQIISIDDLIRKIAANYVYILNEINSQMLSCMIDARENRCLTTTCNTCYEIKLDIDRTQKKAFISLLDDIKKLRSDNQSSDDLFIRKILESNETRHPILDEEQTDDTGSCTLHRIILLDDDLLPYRNVIFVK